MALSYMRRHVPLVTLEDNDTNLALLRALESVCAAHYATIDMAEWYKRYRRRSQESASNEQRRPVLVYELGGNDESGAAPRSRAMVHSHITPSPAL